MFTKTFLAVLAFSPLFAHASAIWNVTVGGAAGLVYTPTSVQAEVGDTVHFIFESANHTVTQSTFDAPCSPILGGVNTGFNQAISPDATSGFKTFDIVVQSLDPFWIHCMQDGHCPAGMVFAINPQSTGETYQAFLANALALASNSSSSVTTPAPTDAVTSTVWRKRSVKWARNV